MVRRASLARLNPTTACEVVLKRVSFHWRCNPPNLVFAPNKGCFPIICHIRPSPSQFVRESPQREFELGHKTGYKPSKCFQAHTQLLISCGSECHRLMIPCMQKSIPSLVLLVNCSIVVQSGGEGGKVLFINFFCKPQKRLLSIIRLLSETKKSLSASAFASQGR